jgi:hypothetical protein
MVAVRRGPRRSIQRPITGAGRIPASVPTAYAIEAEVREMPMHAQTDHHPQYADRTPAKMGSQPLRSELTERIAPLRSVFGRAHAKPNRPVSGRGQGRQPPKAVARQRQP